MTKEELFKKYSINESHNVWEDRVDNWTSVEIYRIMHDGKLPGPNDLSTEWIVSFLSKTEDMKFMSEMMQRSDWGSLYLTAKRMVCRLYEQTLKNNDTRRNKKNRRILYLL